MAFKETSEGGFDADDFAIHKTCGTTLVEDRSLPHTKSYNLKRDGSTIFIDEDDDNDEQCDGMWCPECDMPVTMEKAGG